MHDDLEMTSTMWWMNERIAVYKETCMYYWRLVGVITVQQNLGYASSRVLAWT